MVCTQTDPSRPDDLDQMLDRLRANEQVAGVLAIGSLANDALTVASDYDLVIVLEAMEPAWYVGVTHIQGRFTDLIFVSADALRRIVERASPLPTTHELAPIVRWMLNGKILFDRSRQLGDTQRHVRQQRLLESASDQDAYAAWFATNYNLAVVTRLVTSPDPLYQSTAEIRIAVYGHSDLWLNYFAIRQIAWAGDKTAVQYLDQHEPGYLDLYRRFIACGDRSTKLEYYRRAAAHVTGPMGGLWTRRKNVTNMLSPPWTWPDLVGTVQ
jgi:hypothetical protein